MSESRLVGHSTPDRTLAERELGTEHRSGTWRSAKENAPAPRARPEPERPVTIRTKCFWCPAQFRSHKEVRIHERRCREAPRSGEIPRIPLEVILGVLRPDDDRLYSHVIADRLAEVSEEWAGLTALQVGRAIARHGVRSRQLGRGQRGYLRADLLAARDGIAARPIPVGAAYSYDTKAGPRWGYKMTWQSADGLTSTTGKKGFLTQAMAEQHLQTLKRANEIEHRKALKEYAIRLALEDGIEKTPEFRCSCTSRDNECSRWPEPGHGTWWVRLAVTGPGGKRIQPLVRADEYQKRGGKLRKPRLRLRIGAQRRARGDGSVWPRTMANGRQRFDIGGVIINPDGTREKFTRRAGRNGEEWTTRQDAEDALADVWQNGLWRRIPPVPAAAKRRAIREALGLSLDAVAEACGVCPKTVRNWENGAEPAGEHAGRYAMALRHPA